MGYRIAVKGPYINNFARPPLRLIVIILGMLFVSLQGWIRFVLSLSNWALYEAFGVLPGVWYLVGTGFLSGLVYFLAAFFALWQREKFRKLSASFLLIGLAGYWFDRLFAVVSPEARISLLFSLISSLGLTGIAIGTLYWDTIFRWILKTGKINGRN
jgi:hypothetical protein